MMLRWANFSAFSSKIGMEPICTHIRCRAAAAIRLCSALLCESLTMNSRARARSRSTKSDISGAKYMTAPFSAALAIASAISEALCIGSIVLVI